MAKPTVAIRVTPELYQEVFGIAEDRDVSMTEAMDMLIYRLRKKESDGDRPKRAEGPTRAKGKRSRAKAKRTVVKLFPKPGTF